MFELFGFTLGYVFAVYIALEGLLGLWKPKDQFDIFLGSFGLICGLALCALITKILANVLGNIDKNVIVIIVLLVLAVIVYIFALRHMPEKINVTKQYLGWAITGVVFSVLFMIFLADLLGKMYALFKLFFNV